MLDCVSACLRPKRGQAWVAGRALSPVKGYREPGEEVARAAAALAGGFALCACSSEDVAAFAVGGEVCFPP